MVGGDFVLFASQRQFDGSSHFVDEAEQSVNLNGSWALSLIDLSMVAQYYL